MHLVYASRQRMPWSNGAAGVHRIRFRLDWRGGGGAWGELRLRCTSWYRLVCNWAPSPQVCPYGPSLELSRCLGPCDIGVVSISIAINVLLLLYEYHHHQ